MVKKYIKRSREEKMAYSTQFSKSQIQSYRAGKRMGFLESVHAKKKYK